MRDTREYSVFWPIILIAVGVIWLLSNFNILPAMNFGLLVHLWPLLLIVAGINLLIGRRYPLLRALVTLAAVAFGILYMLFAQQLGIVQVTEVQQANLVEPIGEAKSATVRIRSSIGRTYINPLVDSSALIEADLKYVGDLVFDVSGSLEKIVDLRVETDALEPEFYNFTEEDKLRWDIGLTPNIPLNLDFSGGVGEIVMDLTGLTLTDVFVSGGVGELEVTLPAQEGLYTVTINGGVGQFVILIEDGAELQLDIDAGVGEFIIDIPDQAGVELSAQTGVGRIRLPSNFNELRPVESGIGVNGNWQSENFDTADYTILIDFKGGVGDLRIR